MYVYHATDKENLPSIMENGLLARPPKHNWEGMTTAEWGDYLFLALDADAAEAYVEVQDDAPDDIVVFKIKLDNVDENRNGYDWNNLCESSDEINSVLYSGDVHPDDIEICDTDDEPFQDIDSFKGTGLYDNVMTEFNHGSGNSGIWVRPHFRKGRPVKGHYRRRRS